MSMTLTKKDVESIIWGGALLGSGGGGGLDLALGFLKIIQDGQTFTVIDLSDEPTSGVVTAFVGSPDALTSLSAKPIWDAYERFTGIRPAATVVPVETGAVNSIAPFLIALKYDVSIADADGAGRAVPQLTDLVFNDGISVQPIVLSDGAGVAATLSVPDAATAESLVRSVVVTPEFGEVGGLALWGMNQGQFKSNVIWGTVQTALKLGQAIQSGLSLPDLIHGLGSLGRKAAPIVTGTFKAGAETTGGGFDIGYNTIESKEGITTIYNQNENLIAYNSWTSAPLAVAPTSICYWNSDTRLPFTNVEAKENEGANVALIAIEPLPDLIDSPSATKGFIKTLAGIGYAGALGG